jgi:hypothetical protein
LYVPENPTTSKVRISVQKFRSSPNVTSKSIYARGSASIPGTTPWNGVVDDLSVDHGMPILSNIDE